MATLADCTFDPDLRTGVVPISKAASSLAALLRQAERTRRPIVVTQKGYPQAVLLSVECYNFSSSSGSSPAMGPAPARATPPR